MKGVELYGRIRNAVQVEGLSHRAAARPFGIDPRTVAKMMKFTAPPGYVRTKPPTAPRVVRSRSGDADDASFATPNSWFIKMITQTQMNRSRQRKSGPVRVSPVFVRVRTAGTESPDEAQARLTLTGSFLQDGTLSMISQRTNPGSSPLTLCGILCRQPGPALFPTHSKTSSRVSSHSIFQFLK